MKRFHYSPRQLKAALVGVGSIFLSIASLNAQSVWQTGDGDWFTASNWSGGLPNGSNVAVFQVSAASPDPVRVSVGTGAVTAKGFRVLHGKEAQLDLSDGTVIEAIGEIWRVGYSAGSGATLQFNGPETGEATVKMAAIMLGAHAEADGAQLVFNGSGLKVVQEGGLDYVAVGRFGTNQKLRVENGADVSVQYVELGSASSGGGRIGHEVHVTGAGSKLSTVGKVTIGASGEGARDNRGVVSGNGATLSVGAILAIGVSNGYGGNSLEVSNGGTVVVTSTSIIAAYNPNGGDNGGANRLSILQSGTFKAGKEIDSYGIIQLQEGGALLSGTDLSVLTVKNGGRAELEGSGLAANVSIQVENGGRLAVGLTDANGPRNASAALTLDSKITFASGSELTLSLFDNGGDQIELLANGSLQGTVKLNLQWLGAGSPPGSWTLFTGETENITATFVVSHLDPEVWDLSNFNEAGGWEVRAIPEGSFHAMLGMALLVFSTFRARYATLRR